MELDDLLEAKSRELKDLQDKKILSLNDEIRCQESQLQSVRDQYSELKDNFEYNLNLLNERDTELTRYDQVITELSGRIGSHMAEMSDVKVELADTRQSLAEEGARKEELKQTFQNRLRDIELTMEHQYRAKEQEVSNQLTETSRVKQQLELQLSELEEDRERKRRAWERNFEEEITQLTRAHGTKLSDYNTKLFQAEGKIKQITAEREALRMTVSELEVTVTAQDRHITGMEEAVRQAEWDVNSYISLQQARISELEDEVKKMTEEEERREKTVANRASIAEARLSEKDKQLKSVKMSHEERDRASRSRVKLLEVEMEELKMEATCARAKLEDRLSEANEQIDTLKASLQERTVELETEYQKSTRHEINLKLEQQHGEERTRELKVELEMKRQDIARYRTELAVGVKREEALKSEAGQEMKMMMMRCEKSDSRAYGSQEEFVLDLTAARDKCLADLIKMKADLSSRDDEIRTLRGKLSRNNTDNVPNVEMDDGVGQILQAQNNKLKEVIREMTREMQDLAEANRSTVQPTEKMIVQPVRAEEEEENALRTEVMYLRRMIISHKNKELESSRSTDEFVNCQARLKQLERERDRLLELSNSQRAQLNTFQEKENLNAIPLKDITAQINTARLSLHRSRSTASPNSSPAISLLHMSGDTSLNEELSDLCRLVESEENRPMSAHKPVTVEVKGNHYPPISPPKPIIGTGRLRKIMVKAPPKSKIRNYNLKTF